MTNGRPIFQRDLDILEDSARRNLIKFSKKSAAQVEELHALVWAVKQTSELQLHRKRPGGYSRYQDEHGPRRALSLPVR